MASTQDYSTDPSLDDDTTGGKTSLFGKLKSKTKDKTNKLKTKLKPGSKSGNPDSPSGEGDTGFDSDEYEDDSPTGNPVEGAAEKTFGGSTDTPSEAPTGDGSFLAKDFQGLSTHESTPGNVGAGLGEEKSRIGDITDQDKPLTDKASDAATPYTDKVAETTAPIADQATETVKPYTDKVAETTAPYTEKAAETVKPYTDKVAETAAPYTDKASATAGDLTNKTNETGKSWGQWATEKVGLAKETAAANVPTTAEGKPVTDQAAETATGAKDALAEHTDPAKIPSDPAQQSYVQKATGGIYAAKDSLFTSTQPGEHDKALSQTVTETVGNFPASIKSLFGSKTPGAASPTTTPVSDTSLTSPSDEASGAPPQSPGLVSRFTSLFGAAKKPATEEAASTTESTPTE